MSQKPVEWVAALIERFQDQLPIKVGELTKQMRHNAEQKQKCLVNLSQYKFSLVINGLIDILRSIEALSYSSSYYSSATSFGSSFSSTSTKQQQQQQQQQFQQQQQQQQQQQTQPSMENKYYLLQRGNVLIKQIKDKIGFM